MKNTKAQKSSLLALGLTSLIGLSCVASATAQTAAPVNGGGGASPSKQAVENRRAAYTLIGNNFRYFGAVTKGAVPYDATEAAKRASRIAFLAGIVGENFPEGSNVGEPESKAKAEIWSNRADFDKKLADFVERANAFVEASAKEKSANDSLKSAIAALGQDCKGCHELYKAK